MENAGVRISTGPLTGGLIFGKGGPLDFFFWVWVGGGGLTVP